MVGLGEWHGQEVRQLESVEKAPSPLLQHVLVMHNYRYTLTEM